MTIESADTPKSDLALPPVVSPTLLNGHGAPLDGFAGANDFHRFLRVKQIVDDRALHAGVFASLRDRLTETGGDRLQVLEIGCGIGTMLDRLERWGMWSAVSVPIQYTALDREAANILAMPPVNNARVQVTPVCSDFYPFAAEATAAGRTWDLVIAHAVLDLLDLERALPLMQSILSAQGMAWLTLNFDGGTILLPTIDRDFDDLVEARYHRTMDERLSDGAPSGDSRTGRALFDALPAAGLQIVAAGASDWIVSPARDRYSADEREFLHFIVATMQRALAGDEALDAVRFAEWIATRFRQIERGELTYLAKQYDFLVQRQR